jgi:multidrug efflux pump subunit AcrA (membrane-fusion protein)
MTARLNVAEQPQAMTDPLADLVGLSRRARQAADTAELAFLAVNDSHALCPYRQGALWFAGSGIEALSGVVEPEANAPYAQWLNRTCRFLDGAHRAATAITASTLPSELGGEWAEWLPPHGLWLPFGTEDAERRGGLLLASEQPWPQEAVLLLQEWMDVWHHAWTARMRSEPWSWLNLKLMIGKLARPDAGWWKRRKTKVVAAILLTMLFPVRLTVLAPGELVPSKPVVIRAPVDGVIGQFDVQPNQAVKAGQPLFSFDEASVATKRDVAQQAVAAAETEYRQYAQQALSDSRYKAQLAQLLSKVAERRAEADYYKSQYERSRVVAPQDGIALLDDPSEWIGKAVQTGERIMRIAVPGDVEIEAWLPIGNALPLPEQADVNLYLASSPLSSLSAKVRYMAHDAVVRPDGTYAYRVRASLEQGTEQRVGLKGTVKLSGGRVPLIYWMLRRPLATIRQALGV